MKKVKRQIALITFALVGVFESIIGVVTLGYLFVGWRYKTSRLFTRLCWF